MKINAPTSEEYASFYADYVQRGIARGDVLAALPKQIDELNALLGHLSDKQARFKFGPAEWSIKQLAGHLSDAERIFCYRLICISRNDKTPLPGFEQDDYVRESGFDDYSFADLLKEFELLRRASILAINNMPEKSFANIGTASGAPVTARALVYMMVGHVDNHIASLHKNYLPAL